MKSLKLVGLVAALTLSIGAFADTYTIKAEAKALSSGFMAKNKANRLLKAKIANEEEECLEKGMGFEVLKKWTHARKTRIGMKRWVATAKAKVACD